MPTSDPAVPQPRGVLAAARALVRQLSVAVYAYLAFGISAAVLQTNAYVWILEPLLVLAASILVGRLVDGPWWTSSFVGLFVAIFDLGLSGVILGDFGAALHGVALPAGISVLAGALGGALGRRRRRAGASPTAGS
jgi:hypothetical protein